MISLQRPSAIADSMRKIQLYFAGKTVDLTLDINKPTQRYVFDIIESGGIYEGFEVAKLLGVLKEGDTFFDVGACFGWFSAIACAAVGEMGRVLAFEPNPANWEALRENAPLAEVLPVAVGDKSGRVTLFENMDNDGGSSLWPCRLHPYNEATRKAGSPSREINCRHLDEFATLNPVAIKIDTEGAEHGVLLGAQKCLANESLRLVICECNRFGMAQMNTNETQIEELMATYGFTVEAESTDRKAVGNWIFTR